jgi:hypothetical protein
VILESFFDGELVSFRRILKNYTLKIESEFMADEQDSGFECMLIVNSVLRSMY